MNENVQQPKQPWVRQLVLLTLLILGLVLVTAAGAAGDGSPHAPTAISFLPSLHIEVTKLDLLTSKMVYDETRAQLYVIVAGYDDPYLNHAVSIGHNGTLGEPFFIGPDSLDMAISDDGRFLYVAFLNGKVKRFNLETGQSDLEWTLVDSNGDPRIVFDMEVMVGDADVLIAALNGAVLDEVIVFDKGIARPNRVTSTTGFDVINQLEPSNQPGILYGSNETSVFELQITIDGIAVQREALNLFTSRELRFDEGRLYGRDGSIIDVATMSLAGSFNAAGLVLPDVDAGRVLFLHRETYFATPIELRLYDPATFKIIAAGDIPFNYDRTIQPWDLVQLEENLFALGDNDSSLYFIRFALLDQAIAMPVVADNFCADVVDDFSSPVYGWPAGDTPAAAFGLTGDGEYAIQSRVTEPILVRSPFCLRAGYEVSVEARWVGEPGEYYGVRYLIDHPMQQPYGTALIVSTTRRAWMVGIPDENQFPTWYESNAIRPGNEVNQIRVVFNGYEVKGYINGIEVYSNNQFSGPPPHTGVGLIMQPAYPKAAAEARFDNFTYRKVEIPQ